MTKPSMKFTYEELPKKGELIYIYNHDGSYELSRFPNLNRKPAVSIINWGLYSENTFVLWDRAPDKVAEFVNL